VRRPGGSSAPVASVLVLLVALAWWMEPPSGRSSNHRPTYHRPGACPLAVGGQGSSHQSPRQGTEVGGAHLAGRGRQLSSARVACAVLAAVIGVVGLHIQPTRLCSPPRGHRVGSPESDGGEKHQPEGGTMDTSRRPDGPIDSRADRQLRQPQGLQLMKWILSWIQSRPLRWLPARAPSSTPLTRRDHQDAPLRVLRGWRVEGSPVEGGGARPLGGLMLQAGAAAGHPEPTDRGSVRCQTPSQVLPLPSQSRQYRRARTGRPVGPAAEGTDAWHPATPDTHRSGSLKSLDVSVSTGRSHRKDVVSEHGGRPVWHDFPKRRRDGYARSSPPTRILTGHAHQGDPRGQTSTRPHR
jgi:hypothetical protein